MAVKTGKNQISLREHRQALERAVAELPNCVIMFGESDFLRSEAVELFRDAWLGRFPDGDTATFRGAGDTRPATLTDIAAEMAGGSLFAKDKLVVLRQGERVLFPQAGRGSEEGASGSGSGDREKAFLERVANPSARTWLLMESSQLPRNRTLGKKLAELCHIIPCPQPNQREIPAWLTARARSLEKRLDDEAADLLVRAHGTDLGALAGEVDKLALFAGDGRDIDGAMVREFLTGTIEFDIFGFTNAFEARDRRQAVFYARRIAVQGTRNQKGKKEGGEDSAHKVLSMLAGTALGLLRARVAVAAGQDSGEFAALEKVSPWRAGKLMDASGRFSVKELRSMVGSLAERIRGVHDTGGDALLALERIAVEFTKS